MSEPRFVVVGMGADGWDGLTPASRRELQDAEVIYGSRRQLDLLGSVTAALRPWGSPMSEHLATVLTESQPHPVHILASGDPMFHGVGASVVKAVGARNVRVFPAVSSVSHAAARLGWDLATTRICSVVDRPLSSILTNVSDNVQLLVLSRDEQTPEALAKLLTAHGFGWSHLTVLEQLGGPAERIYGGIARTWDHSAGDRLNLVAVQCVGPAVSAQAGLPDTDFSNDGQMTKQAIRALTVTALRPAARQMLWDVGAGAGSVAIEWLRTDPSCSAIAFESDSARRRRIEHNASELGVAHGLTVLESAPAQFGQAPDPDAIFIGGGVSAGGVLEGCWEALLEGGRIVVNAVTIESEALLISWHAAVGGTLRRFQIDHAEPLGSMTAWRPTLPVTQWIADKPAVTT
ncbi:precorrin-6Y C5,15-methyltransferase (decarboxylating) [Williamsia limnetica]|uniref:Precorrin-6Y C5,15-methyltransferase (Decarboxylating) n=1 Tax=Williamsia limnetica TaxID=882452 RepID=A0A318RW21_WILLI|nr:precorrin-6y C5,15-methyltransferase (decarboxylating) subunit CbiE [Williamsia limnetica]PYE20912.1 precorrin-6Y C5,15-methyltransferase (decarboxylating) [Williamsia limnetica]